jgi:hypothetical protein
VPLEAAAVAFDLWVTTPSDDDTLVVRIGDELLADYSLFDPRLQGGFRTETLSFPRADLRGQVTTLTFELKAGGSGIDAEVRVDDVQFKSGWAGRTGDIIAVDLKDAFGDATFTDLNLALFGVQTEVDERGDLVLRGSDGVSFGKVALSERVDGTPFVSSGRFYFIPETAGDNLGIEDEDRSSRGFQGLVLGHVTVDGVEQEFQIAVLSGYSITKYNSPQKGDGNHAALGNVISHLAITLATDFVDH